MSSSRLPFSSAAAMALIVLILSGCQHITPTSIARDLSIEQFVAPPPGIDEILARIEAAKPVSQRELIEQRKLADQEPSATQSEAELADFFGRRAFAAWALDRPAQATADFNSALAIAERSDEIGVLDRAWFRYQVGLAHFREGEMAQALRLIEQSISELEAPAEEAERWHRLAHLIEWRGFLIKARSVVGDLAGAEADLGWVEEAGTRYREALEAGHLGEVKPHTWPMLEAAMASGRADYLDLIGRHEQAARAHQQASGSLAQSDSWKAWWWMPRERIRDLHRQRRLDEARNLRAQGRLWQAEAIVREMFTDAIERRGLYNTQAVESLLLLAGIKWDQGELEQAQQLAEQNLSNLLTLHPSATSPLAIEQRLMLAGIHAEGRDWSGALRVLEALRGDLGAQAFERALKGDPLYALALWQQGEALRGRAAAETASAQAKRLYGEDHYQRLEAEAVAALANSELPLGRLSNVIDRLIEARMSGRLGESGQARLGAYRQILEAYLDRLVAAGSADHLDELFRVSEAARASRVQEAIAVGALRTGLADQALSDMVNQEQRLQQRLSALYARLFRAATDGSSRSAALRSEIDALEQEAAALKRQLWARFPEYAEMVRPRPPRLASVQAQLKPDEVLIALLVGSERSYIWALSDRKVRLHVAELGSEAIGQTVRSLRRRLDTRFGLRPFPIERAYRELYQPLLEPLESVWRDHKRLIVIPDGALGALPFGLLPTGDQSPSPVDGALLFSEYQRADWLIRDHAIIHLPSISALAALRRQPERIATLPLVGFGDPLFDPERTPAKSVPRGSLQRRAVGGGVRAGDLRRLDPLPDTRLELNDIAATLGADRERDLFLGSAANESAVRNAPLADYRIVAFATHGLIPGDLRGLTEPALALSLPQRDGQAEDGLLTLTEILNLELNAQWVVLSACNTAAGDEAGSEAISGLGRAFFYAGARSLLVTHWPVETVSARLLTTATFRIRAEQPALDRASALRQAKLKLMGQGGEEISYAHPLFWAPYALYGDTGDSGDSDTDRATEMGVPVVR